MGGAYSDRMPSIWRRAVGRTATDRRRGAVAADARRVVRLDESDVTIRYELLSTALESGLRELIGRSGQLRDDFDDVDVD